MTRTRWAVGLCATLNGSVTTGLQARGVVNFFGSALGDIATELFAQCQ